MRFVCIDFETANGSRASACSMGIAIIEDEELVAQYSWLIKPHPDHRIFAPINSRIHGINEIDILTSPEFNEIYPDIETYFEDCVLVAHNASFDMSVLKNLFQLYNIPIPALDYICTLQASQTIWKDLKDHKLKTVCKHLDHDYIKHKSGEDAGAAAVVLLSAIRHQCEYSDCSFDDAASLFISGRLL